MSVYDEINTVFEAIKLGGTGLIGSVGNDGNARPPAVQNSILDPARKPVSEHIQDKVVAKGKSVKKAEIEAQGSKIEGLLNAQVAHELSNANAYEQCAVWFDVEKRLMGFAAFFSKQACGEREHAAKLLQFMRDCGLKAKIGAIKEPKSEFDSPVAVFEAALELEKETTKMWHNIREVAMAEKNHATEVLSDWYVTEQVEELDLTDEWLTKVKMVGDNNLGLLLLDSQIGK